MNHTGFSRLNDTQLQILYGSKSPYNCSKSLKKLQSLNDKEAYQRVVNDINQMSLMESFKVVLKQQVVGAPVAPITTGPDVDIILSPIIKSPAVCYIIY